MAGPGSAGVSSPCAPCSSEHGVKISPSTYYEWVNKRPTRRQLRDAELVDDHHRAARGQEDRQVRADPGARKVWIRLRGQGHDVARCTVERIMREQGWEGARYGSKHKTTIGDDAHTRYPDLVDRNFALRRRTAVGGRLHLCADLDRDGLRRLRHRRLQPPDRGLAGRQSR